MQGYRAVVDWVAASPQPTVLGFDANHWSLSTSLDPVPVVDDPADHRFLERQFFGPDPPHRLRDPLLDVLRRDPLRYARCMEERPDGPLAVSYMRHGTPDRFDYVFVSPEFTATDVRYDYDGGRAAGSDHALVVADLEYGTRVPPARYTTPLRWEGP